jgi:DNA ligase-1
MLPYKLFFYKGKRSNDLLKVKKFFDAEYIVENIETGMFQVVENGVRKEIETMTSVIIKHKGYIVNVGSGFSLEQRKEYFNDPKKIIGKQICVKFFEETKNQNGGISLRFPTVKFVYSDGKGDA